MPSQALFDGCDAFTIDAARVARLARFRWRSGRDPCAWAAEPYGSFVPTDLPPSGQVPEATNATRTHHGQNLKCIHPGRERKHECSKDVGGWNGRVVDKTGRLVPVEMTKKHWF